MTVIRNPYFDYLRAFAIYLVITGHIINNCIDKGSESRICGILYFIHIPLFLIISGLLTKDKPIMTIEFWKKILHRFIIPYTTWSIILATFYLGSKILYNNIRDNLMIYLNSWFTTLWFIKAYVITYVLWQLLKKLPPPIRLITGSIILIILNLLFIENKIISEICSLSLYSYTLYGTGVCIKNYITQIKKKYLIIFLLIFICCLPFATTTNNYFNSSFHTMLKLHTWHIFIIRYIAGVCISILFISSPPKRKFLQQKDIQSIGQRTLQIYMLQSLLAEAALSRFIFCSNNIANFILVLILSLIITFLSSKIIELTSHFKICKLLLWGTT